MSKNDDSARNCARNKARNSSRENGSAYILVLMVLLVLTLLGLVLAFITQSEVEVGANERTVNRVFYSTEAGISAAFLAVAVNNDHSAKDFRIMDPGSTTLGTHIVVPTPVEVNTGPCNLCEVNQGSDYQDITHSIQVTATRFSLQGGTETALASKNVDLMLEYQPAREALDVGPDQAKWK